MTEPLTLGAPVKHLLIDLDGTLLGNRNIPLGLSFVRRTLWESKKRGSLLKAIPALLSVQREFLRPSDRAKTNSERALATLAEKMNVSLEEAQQFVRDGLGAVFPMLKKHFYPMPGAKDFLEWAQHHIPMTLATNPVWPPDIIELRLEWAGISPGIFKGITHARIMNSCKPDPEYYKQILQIQGVRAEDCMLIGDGLKMDLPATQVGIRVFILGNYPTVEPAKYPGAQASAWKGNYPALKKMLAVNLGVAVN